MNEYIIYFTETSMAPVLQTQTEILPILICFLDNGWCILIWLFLEKTPLANQKKNPSSPEFVMKVQLLIPVTRGLIDPSSEAR